MYPLFTVKKAGQLLGTFEFYCVVIFYTVNTVPILVVNFVDVKFF